MSKQQNFGITEEHALFFLTQNFCAGIINQCIGERGYLGTQALDSSKLLLIMVVTLVRETSVMVVRNEGVVCVISAYATLH